MKTLIALAVLFNISSASAQLFKPGYYSAHFEITNVQPMCPNDIPDGAQCFGLGSIVTVQATIGCADTLVSKNFEVWENNEIHAQSLVKVHPKSNVIRCIRPQVITDTVLVPNPGSVTLVNDTLEFVAGEN